MSESATADVASLLERDGFVLMPGLAGSDQRERFEREVGAISASLARNAGSGAGGDAGLIEVFRRGGDFRSVVYSMLQGLRSLRRITAEAVQRLEEAGLLQQRGIAEPSVLTNLRVDLPRETDFALPMHQDYAGMRSPNAIRVWLPLRPVGPDTGSMTVIRESHLSGPLEHNRDDPKKPVVLPSAYDESQAVPIEAAAGTGVVFDMLLLHESILNMSDSIKFVLVITIQDMLTLVDPDDPDDKVGAFFHIAEQRAAARNPS